MTINKLKKVRQEKGLTQEELAVQTKISTRSVQNYEASKRTPDVYTAQRLSNALGEDIENLFPMPRDIS